MKAISCLIAAAGIFCLATVSTSRADALFDKVQLVADATVANSSIPQAQTFTISQSGSYTITLTDLQLPTALASLSLAIANSTSTAVTLPNTTAQPSSYTQTVTLKAGTYTAQVLATAASGALGGAFGVQVVPVGGGTAVLEYSDVVGPATPAVTTGQSVLSAKFTVTDAGTYQLTANDLTFPIALTSLQLIIFNDCGTTSGCITNAIAPTPLSGAQISSALTLAAGTYDLFVVAAADATALQGLYGIQIAGGPSNAVVYASTNPVGQLPTPIAIPVAASGTVSLQLADLATPAPLQSVQAVAIQGSSVLQQLSTVGAVTFAANSGTVQLYVIAQPSGAQGSFEAYATMGSQVLADVAQPVLMTGSFGYAYATSLASGGSYQAGVYDFQLPKAFTSLTVTAAQAGALLTPPTSSSGAFTAAAGALTILVFPALSTPTDNGLFGVQLVGPGAGGATAFETTQGVGALFSTQTFTVTSAGSYDVTLSDLAFPGKFSSLAVIATRGYTLAGQVFGGGTLGVTATPGTYVLNVLAQVGTGVDFGLYGLNVQPSPTVTLTASSSSVSPGGQVTLSWNSSNTTGCSASASPSASGWTGALQPSGMQPSGSLSAATTFTISCAGNSGSTATATANVAITVPAAGSSHHGGGAFSSDSILALLLALGVQIARRRRSLPSGRAG